MMEIKGLCGNELENEIFIKRKIYTLIYIYIYKSYVTTLTYINGQYGRFTKDFLILGKKNKCIYKKIMYNSSIPSISVKLPFNI